MSTPIRTTHEPYFLAADLGTSALKAGLFTGSGQQLAAALVEYPTRYPRPAWAEQQPDDWWQAACVAIRKCLAHAQLPPQAIQAVAVSGQAPSCVPIDRQGRPLRPAILWIDRRATREVSWIEEHVGQEQVWRVSGNHIDGYYGGVKWLWFRNHEPDLFGQTWKILQAHSYVIFRLTGEVVTDLSHAGLCSPCFDLHHKRWSVDMCETLGISLAVLPELAPSHQIIGRVSQTGAQASGLAPGTPVVTGAGDFACCTLGCGVIDPGQASQMLGTAGNLAMPRGKRIDPDPRLVNTLHATGDYLTFGSTYAGGVVQWFKQELGAAEIQAGQQLGRSAYELLDEAAASIAPGAEGLILLPYFMGERTPLWDAQARGVYLGISPYHTRAHLYRAALEGVAYAFRHMIEIVEERGGRVDEIVAVNGGARSALWRQIFADVLGARIKHYPGGAATLLGDVALAGVGIGCFRNFDVVRHWQHIVETNEPRPEVHTLYRDYYTLFRHTYAQLQSQFKQLAELGQRATRITTIQSATGEEASL